MAVFHLSFCLKPMLNSLRKCTAKIYLTFAFEYIKTNQTDFNLSVGCFGIDAEMVDPKTHEMVSDRSSRAENWTDLRKISMRVFFGSKNSRKKDK